MASSDEDVQITCRFVTRLPEKYRIAPTPLAVPGKLTRYGLSEVVNHLLALDPPKPFDFLVDGELVRTSLEKLLLRKQITAERTLDVEYIPAVGPPSEEAVGKHEDWVSCVDGGYAGAIATGCYDGSAKLWTRAGSLLLTLPVNNPSNNAVTSVALLPSVDDKNENGVVVVAGAHDGVVRSWDVEMGKKKASSKSSRAFIGHAQAVVAVASAPGGEFFASASNDGTARVWRRDGGTEWSEDGASLDTSSAKRRKAESGAVPGAQQKRSCLDAPAKAAEDSPMAPLNAELTLTGHRGAVTCVQWESPDAAWTGGDDKTLKRWDVDEGRCSQTFDAPKAVNSVACRADGKRILWSGGGDKLVHAWDPRVGQNTGGTSTFASHTVCFGFFWV